VRFPFLFATAVEPFACDRIRFSGIVKAARSEEAGNVGLPAMHPQARW